MSLCFSRHIKTIWLLGKRRILIKCYLSVWFGHMQETILWFTTAIHVKLSTLEEQMCDLFQQDDCMEDTTLWDLMVVISPLKKTAHVPKNVDQYYTKIGYFAKKLSKLYFHSSIDSTFFRIYCDGFYNICSMIVIRRSILYICLSIIFLKCIKLRIFPEQPRSYNISLGEVLIKLIHSSIIVFWCITETTITKIFSKSSFYVDYNVFCQGFYKKLNNIQKWCWSPHFPCVATELLFQSVFKQLLRRKL